MVTQKRFFLALCLFVTVVLQKPAFAQRNILSKAFTQQQLQKEPHFLSTPPSDKF